ncbi:phage tail tip lysozyme [Mesorhizobium sp. BE184]|uniref:phage tail tip lysozyme n=1 Tax=Mesorhizobium sp. BE184 TaxID=2817714 RepID=UPI0028668744|nr:phage tail tip lysozyme [Mesorhizobium sp. BE184]MDR7032438.1 hypothetical protein [Mesorhizobium sp. BE184]
MTPEEIARQREIAGALLNQAGDTSPVGDWTQGAARVVNALGGVLKERRANQAEASNAAGSQSRIAALLGGMTGGGAAEFPPAPSSAVAAPSGAPPSIPQTAEAGAIRQGLIDRGLPSHVADAFVLNMQDESGLNPGINEQNPTVPGSRGGFGLYQLTGPRRRAYEAFAGQRGVDPSDTNAQLDFLMSELQGPEAKAAQSILSAPDTGTAAAAIVNDFLRPAPEHAASRTNRYMSLAGQGQPVQVASNDPQAAIAAALGAPQQAAPAMSAPQTIQDMPVAEAPQQMAQAAPAPQQGMNPGMQAAIAQALSNPGASPQEKQIATILLQQQMQNADPGNQLDMEYKRAQLDALRNKQQAPQPLVNAGGGAIFNPNTNEWLTAPNAGGAKAPTVQKLKRDDGSELAVQWNDQTGQWDPIDAPLGGGGITPKGGKLTENQSKLTLFQSLQNESQPVLLDLEKQFDPANISDAAARSAPIAGNFFKSEQGQIYDAASTAWAEGALRIATGAAATPEEMERTKKAYFAQPGDTPVTIAFKAQMREMYNRSIERALGRQADGGLPKPSEFVKQITAGPKQPTVIDGYTIEEVE